VHCLDADIDLLIKGHPLKQKLPMFGAGEETVRDAHAQSKQYHPEQHQIRRTCIFVFLLCPSRAEDEQHSKEAMQMMRSGTESRQGRRNQEM
jgi:hypothetical protein